MSETLAQDQQISVNKAFSKQAPNYDADDQINPVLTDLRVQVYDHVKGFMKPGSRILELNAGTGIDAQHFASAGFPVHATDLSDGMIREIRKKINTQDLGGRLTCQQVSYDKLDQVSGKFDYVFSNFGGLNCIQDLSLVTRHLPALLNKSAYVTWVIMPPVCPWEILGVFKGRIGVSFRRLRRDGVTSHLEGHYFKTYYHSLKSTEAAFGDSFVLERSEGLAALSPLPHRGDFPAKHPRLYKRLRVLDGAIRNSFPFNRWADHIIVTFRWLG